MGAHAARRSGCPIPERLWHAERAFSYRLRRASRGILRSGNNPVADYAEWLVASHFGVERAPIVCRGYDVIPGGERIQVKALRESLDYRRTRLSTIHGVEARTFDSLYVVRFTHDLSGWRAWRIPRELVPRYGRRVGDDAYRLELPAQLLDDRRVSEITLERPTDASFGSRRDGPGRAAGRARSSSVCRQ